MIVPGLETPPAVSVVACMEVAEARVNSVRYTEIVALFRDVRLDARGMNVHSSLMSNFPAHVYDRERLEAEHFPQVFCLHQYFDYLCLVVGMKLVCI